MSWTRSNAHAWLRQHEAAFARAGFSAKVIGSVATRGASANDLDLKLLPRRPVLLSKAIEQVIEHILPAVSDQTDVEPLPTDHPEPAWFLSIALVDSKVVELYLTETDFPLEWDSCRTPETDGGLDF